MSGADWTPAGLWLAAAGGFSWTDGKEFARPVAALWPLTVGHLLAMLVVLLPFALLVTLVEWQQQIQIGAPAIARKPH